MQTMIGSGRAACAPPSPESAGEKRFRVLCEQAAVGVALIETATGGRRERDAFASIALDFNNLLTVIRLSAEGARSELAPGHAACASIDDIADAARRAENLVRQVLTFSRTQSASRVRLEGGQRGPVDGDYVPLRVSDNGDGLSAEEVRGTHGAVIYVDDEPALMRPVLMLLRQLGYRATGFASPREALSAVQANPMAVDLVLTDLSMPELSGLDLARELHAVRPNLPIVLVSGFAPQPNAQLAHFGIRHRLTKPFDAQTLASVLGELIVPSAS